MGLDEFECEHYCDVFVNCGIWRCACILSAHNLSFFLSPLFLSMSALQQELLKS